MKLLAIDTSTNYLSLALMKDGKIIGKFHRRSDMRHSSLLVPMIDKLLKKSGSKIKDIDAFCISVGPGSFTGLRIGVTTVKGLSYCLKKPIVAVPTLDVIAANVKNFSGVICPVLNARKNKVYACIYESDGKAIKRISKYLLLPAEELEGKLKNIKKSIAFLGDAVGPIYPAKPKVKDWQPKASVVARIGHELFNKKKFTRPEDLEPLYLYSRECDITGW